MNVGKVTKILHAGISVYNMQESLEWYNKNLGFVLVKDSGYCSPLGAKICFMEKDGFQIELFEYDDPKPIPEDRLIPNIDLQTIGTKHVAFAVDHMSAMKDRLSANGVDIAYEVRMGGNEVMFIRDCNGILIELIEQIRKTK